MSGLYDRVILIISKPPDRREDREIVELLPWFQKKSELFRSLGKDVVLDLIRNCQFSAVGRDTVVIRQGEQGDSFFIILRGVVSVYVNTDIADKDELLTEHLPLKYNESRILDRKQFGQELNTLESGKAFGELALINDNCIRNASIIADESTDLLVVNRELFNRSLCAAQAADFAARTRFAQEHPLFRDWAAKHRRQLAMSLRREKRGFDQNVVKQGDKANAMYFLIKGQGKVTVDAHLHRSQFPQLLSNADQKSLSQNSIYEDRKKKQETARDESSDPLFCPSFADQRRKNNRRKRIEISVVAVNEILGDIEFVLDLKAFVYSVTCIQDCEFFSLNAQNYDRLVTRRNPKTSELLRDSAQLKLFSRLSRFQPDELPLLRTLLERLEADGAQKTPQKRKGPLPFRAKAGARSTRAPLLRGGPVLDKQGPGTTAKPGQGEANPRGRKQGPTRAVPEDPAPVTGTGSSDLGSPEGEGSPDAGGAPFCFPMEAFEDRETSDEALSALEDRIRRWHEAATAAAAAAVATGANSRDCTRLRRLYVDNVGVLPGFKVIVRRRPVLRIDLPDFFRSSSSLLLQALQSPGSDEFRILGSDSSPPLSGESGIGFSPFPTRAFNSNSQTQVENKGEGECRNYNAGDYSILKKQLLKSQRQAVKSETCY